jgi:hypothetical protein
MLVYASEKAMTASQYPLAIALEVRTELIVKMKRVAKLV